LGAQLQQTGVSPADDLVLLTLSEAQGRQLQLSELAASIDWQRSRQSHHLGRMERRGVIRRNNCATDNRGAGSRSPTMARRRSGAPVRRTCARSRNTSLTVPRHPPRNGA